MHFKINDTEISILSIIDRNKSDFLYTHKCADILLRKRSNIFLAPI